MARCATARVSDSGRHARRARKRMRREDDDGGHPSGLAEVGPAADAAAVLALGSRVSLPSGTVLFELGAPADHLYIIDRGRVNLTLPMQVFGHEEDILVEERVAGQTLGWSALIPPHRFTLKATAQIDTELLVFRARGPARPLCRPSRGGLRGGRQRGGDGRPAPAGVPGHVAARDEARARALARRPGGRREPGGEMMRGDAAASRPWRRRARVRGRRRRGVGAGRPRARRGPASRRRRRASRRRDRRRRAGRPSISRCRRRRSPRGSSPARPATPR